MTLLDIIVDYPHRHPVRPVIPDTVKVPTETKIPDTIQVPDTIDTIAPVKQATTQLMDIAPDASGLLGASGENNSMLLWTIVAVAAALGACLYFIYMYRHARKS